jgi:hypothetical protein
MAAYKMAAVKFTPPTDFPLGLIRSHPFVIHLILMLGTEGGPQRVVRDLCPTLYIKLENICFLSHHHQLIIPIYTIKIIQI